jgi:hypothetical protein
MTWNTVEDLAMALVKAQDRHGARTLRAILIEAGRPDAACHAAVAGAAGMAVDAAVDMGHPDQAAALVTAVAAWEGGTLAPLDVAAGLKAVGLYHRTIAPLARVTRRRLAV